MTAENARLREALARSMAVVQRANGLASLGLLTAGLAHEIRSPLVALRVFAQLLQSAVEVAARLGDLGGLYYFYNFAAPATAALTNARALTPRDFRWPYLLAVVEQGAGDVEGRPRCGAGRLTGTAAGFFGSGSNSTR